MAQGRRDDQRLLQEQAQVVPWNRIHCAVLLVCCAAGMCCSCDPIISTPQSGGRKPCASISSYEIVVSDKCALKSVNDDGCILCSHVCLFRCQSIMDDVKLGPQVTPFPFIARNPFREVNLLMRRQPNFRAQLCFQSAAAVSPLWSLGP